MNDDICSGDSVNSEGDWFISFSLQDVLHRSSLLKKQIHPKSTSLLVQDHTIQYEFHTRNLDLSSCFLYPY